MCGFTCGYHDINACYYGSQNNTISPYNYEVATIFTMLQMILIMNKHLHLHPNTSYYYYKMRISKRQILFLDLKQYHSLENAETKNYFFY